MIENMYITIVVALLFIVVILYNKITPPLLKVTNVQFMSADYTKICKGIAMMLIMIGHCTSYFEGARLLTPFGGIGVSIFLIASGYGLNESYKRHGLSCFWKKRVLKVWIPYLIVLLLFSPVKFKSVEYLLGQMIGINCPYWFVTYILLWYVAFYVSCRWFSKYKTIVLFMFSLVSFFLYYELAAEQSLGFIIGVLMSEHINEIKKIIANRRRLIIMSAWSLFVIGVVFLAVKQLPELRQHQGDILYNAVQLMIKCPISLAIILGVYYMPYVIDKTFLALTGLISYELYLVHFRLYGYIGKSLILALSVIVFSYMASWILYNINSAITKRLTK